MAIEGIIARNARRFREESGQSIGGLARKAGLAKQTIVSIEGGHGNPTVQTLGELADALGVSIRALVSELGTEVLVHSGDSIRWEPQGGMQVRQLDQAFGSGYVVNNVLRLEAEQGPSRPRATTRGSLRHCYVLEGRVRLGPVGAPLVAEADDFVRFPGDAPHVFEAITPIALVFVCTTAPQLSMTGSDRLF